MRVHNLRLKACVCGVLAAAAVGSAFAEEKVTMLEEIVVTAQKRSESLQEVPISIAAFTEATRNLIGVKTVQDITDFTPGVTYQTSLDRMTVRGVGRLTNNLATDPGVATYVDGVFNSSNWSGGLSPLFFNRIEFLRGPQGTLYGRNSIGGAMNVIGKRPTQEWNGEIRSSYENYKRQVVEGRMSGPIADWLRFSLGGNSTEQQKGWFKNVNGGPGEGGVVHDSYLQAQLSANIGSAVDLWVAYSHWDVNRSDRNTSTVNSSQTYDPAFLPPQALVPNVNYCAPGATCATPPVYSGVRNYATGFPMLETDPVDTYMAEAIVHMGFADLKYIGGYTSYLYYQQTDLTGTANRSISFTPPGGTAITLFGGQSAPYKENKRYFSNEINLTSTNDGSLQWIVGLYQYKEHYDQYLRTIDPWQPQLAFQTDAALGGFGPVTPNPDNETYRAETWNTTNSRAVFGQLDWKMASTLKGTLGARYTWDKKDALEEAHLVNWNGTTNATGRTITQFVATGPGSYAGACVGCLDRNLAKRWGAATGTTGLEWTPSDGTMTYLKFTRGYKSGGFNSGSIVANPYTEAEHINAFEAGLKQDVTKDLQINTSVFFYKYMDAQVPVTVTHLGGPNTTAYLNLPDVHNYGGDVSLTWNATSALQFMLTYGYLKSKIIDGCCFVDPVDPTAKQPGANQDPNSPVGGQSVVGSRMPGAPENQGSFVANYRFDFSPGSFTLVGTYAARSSEYYSIFNREYNRGGGYGTAGFRGLWVDADNRFSLIGYVKNAFDKIASDNVVGALSSNDMSVTRTLIPPRTYGLEVQIRFGTAAK